MDRKNNFSLIDIIMGLGLFRLFNASKDTGKNWPATDKKHAAWPYHLITHIAPTVKFPEAVRLFFSRLTVCNGRSRCSEFWWIMLAVAIIYLVLWIAGRFVFPHVAPSLTVISSPFVYLAIWLLTIPLQCRRLHDGNCSTAWVWVLTFLFIVKTVLSVWEHDFYDMWGYDVHTVKVITDIIFYLLLLITMGEWCEDSYPGDNKWGPSPKYEYADTSLQDVEKG